jgi:23S rRNA (cytidine1920-2'-O)/16S rRNA (cytidine1409-2'-O)-methyltransferase
VRRGLVPSRTRAAEDIAAGRVTVGGAPAATPARQVSDAEAVAVLDAGPEYVSRGGQKLAAALDAFAIDVRDRSAVDVGSSTGGFTDCLLQRGAREVLAVDVGTNQLAWSLRQDPRVVVLERTDVRALEELDPTPDVCVVDVSFISLRSIVDALLRITNSATEFVLLIKPQFEVGRERLPRGGVVRDPEVHTAALHEVVAALGEHGLGVRAVIPSPIRGAEGNIEFLAHARAGSVTVTQSELEDAVKVAA